jgi:MFS family permease
LEVEMPAITQMKEVVSSARPARRQWLALTAVVAGYFITTLDNTVVNVALPSIQRDLHLGLARLAWIVNAYILSFAVLLLTG